MEKLLANELTIGSPEWWSATPEPYRAGIVARLGAGYIRLVIGIMKRLPRKASTNTDLDWNKVRSTFTKTEGYISGLMRTPHGAPAEGCPVPSIWFLPEEKKSDINQSYERTILYVHGGSYCLERTKLHSKLADNLANQGQARVLAVDFGLAPEHPFPDGIEDVVKCYKWLLNQGLSEKKIAIVGDSAGAGIALAALIAMRDNNIPLPEAYVALCPWADLTFSGASIVENAKSDLFMSDLEFISMFATAYRQGASAHHTLVSPALADLHGMPNTLVHASGADMLLDDSHSIVNGIRKAGGRARLDVWDEMPHVWQKLSGLLPESKTSLVMIGHFLRSCIPSSNDMAA